MEWARITPIGAKACAQTRRSKPRDRVAEKH